MGEGFIFLVICKPIVLQILNLPNNNNTENFNVSMNGSANSSIQKYI